LQQPEAEAYNRERPNKVLDHEFVIPAALRRGLQTGSAPHGGEQSLVASTLHIAYNGTGVDSGLTASEVCFRMPTIRGIAGPYRLFFYSFDCSEPKHVHVRRERKTCKFWLEPVVLGANNGFSARELNRIRKMIVDNLDRITEAWDEHCGE